MTAMRAVLLLPLFFLAFLVGLARAFHLVKQPNQKASSLRRQEDSPPLLFASTATSSIIGDTSVPSRNDELVPPHAGSHFRSVHPAARRRQQGPKRNGRFFEGWYYRITLPDQGVSFAFIYSIEDPQGTPLSLACQQIMGPDDEYLVQADSDVTKFWALPESQSLGCIMEYQTNSTIDRDISIILSSRDFSNQVQSGFQALIPFRLQGKCQGHDGSLGGVMPGQGIEGTCEYNMTIRPIAGWGDAQVGQKSTAGWLAQYPVFEPHWQVTLADGRATGSVVWKNTTYHFQDVPLYAEKNWGGAFPIKWYWCQCNSFEGYWKEGEPTLSVTAGGGTRKIPLGKTESLGMVSVHYNGTFYEATPWIGTMEWEISPWGYWNMTGRSIYGNGKKFQVELLAACDSPGVKLRAPTETDGMVYFCRDSFLGNVTLSLWELDWNVQTKSYERGKVIIDQAKSSQAALEVGGGPWWDDWKAASVMKQPMRGMVRLPYRISNLRKRISSIFRRKDK